MISDFSKIKKVHFIGIGGIGISAVARMMSLEGKEITGSDRDESEVTQELKKERISVTIGQKAENIVAGIDLVIYTVAIPENNAELMKARELGIECITYPQALAIISKDKFTIAVSGTHGKTTTTAMIAKMLIDAGMDPTVIVGSILKDQKSNFIAGKSKYLVVEACEYKRSFLNLHPNILVITNIDDDHLDYYKDIEDIKSAFIELIGQVDSQGQVICDLELPHIGDVAKKAKAEVIDYELFGDINLELKVPGEHNLANAAAVLAVADVLKIPRADAKKSLEGFSGTWRRFEFKGETKNGALVYDDYGHHPTEVEATLSGARDLFPDKNITVVFQPHLYSRTKQHLTHFGTSFKNVTNVIIAPIYAAREPVDPSISSELLAQEISKSGVSAQAMNSFDEIEKHLNTLKKGDVIMTMGAGDIYKVGEKILAH
ncbi:MAG: Mur ligase family protein [Patescibacteria group bacterium]